MCSGPEDEPSAPRPRALESASGPRSGNETCYRLLVETSEDVIFQLDRNGCYLFVNEAAARRLGCCPQDIIGQPLSSFFPADVERLLQPVQQVFETGRITAVERMATTRGKPVHYSTVLTPVTDASGTVQSVVGIARDISRQKWLLRTVKRSRLHFKELVENMGEGVGIVDTQECFRFANLAAHKLFGLPPGSLRGRSLRGLVSDKGWERILHETNQRREGRKSTYELEIIRADGQPRTISVTATPKHSRSGKYLGAFGVFSDVTEKKKIESALRRASEELEERVRQRTMQLHRLVEELQREIQEREKTERARQQSEMRFRALFATASDAVFIKNQDQQYVEVNHTMEVLFQRPVAELIGKSDLELFGPELAEQMGANEQRVLAGETTAEEHKQSIGEEARVFHIIKAPLKDRSNKIVGICGIARDITERKAVEEELIRSQERLRALAAHAESNREEENKRIAREIHDELGQNVTAAKFELAALRKVIPKGQSELKARLEAAESLLDSLAGDIRRISQNLRPPLLDYFGLEAAVECLARDFEHRTGVHCDLKFTTDGLSLDDAGATGIFRICQEALTNVARHAQASAVKMTFRVDRGNLHIDIVDDGKGIDLGQRDSHSLGLLGMEERTLRLGGLLTVCLGDGGGTRIAAKIPLNPGLDPAPR